MMPWKRKAKQTPAPRVRREFSLYMEVRDDEPLSEFYRDVLEHPIRSRMDYRKDCLRGKPRQECNIAELLGDLRVQYQEDDPHRYKKGLPGPDMAAYRAIAVECQTCILHKNRPGSKENVRCPIEEPVLEPLPPTPNDAHRPRRILFGTVGSWHGRIMTAIRRGGESPKKEPRKPRIRYREALPDETPQEPEAVNTVQEPQATGQAVETAEPARSEAVLDQEVSETDESEPTTEQVEPPPVEAERPAPKPRAKKVPAKKPAAKKKAQVAEEPPAPELPPEPVAVEAPTPKKKATKATPKKAPAKAKPIPQSEELGSPKPDTPSTKTKEIVPPMTKTSEPEGEGQTADEPHEPVPMPVAKASTKKAAPRKRPGPKKAPAKTPEATSSPSEETTPLPGPGNEPSAKPKKAPAKKAAPRKAAKKTPTQETTELTSE